MKKIFVVIPAFRHGGTNKSLQNLLSLIDRKGLQVEVFCLDHTGAYRNMLPNCVILPEVAYLHYCFGQAGDMKGWRKQICRGMKIVKKLLSACGVDMNRILFDRSIRQVVGDLNAYDAIVAYAEGITSKLVSGTSHRNKIAFIHCEYSSYLNLNGIPAEAAVYNRFDHIVSVSMAATSNFVHALPQYESKALTIYNCVDNEMVKRCAVSFNPQYDETLFNIVSVGRIDPVKRFSEIPAVAEVLKAANVKFRWYIVGGSRSRKEWDALNGNIKRHRVEREIVLLGERDNPYPYIAHSDLLVCLSSSESFNYTVNEAKVLGVPCISADYPCAKEFITDGFNGYVCSVGSMPQKITSLMTDRDLYHRMKQNCAGFVYDNSPGIALLENIIQCG